MISQPEVNDAAQHAVEWSKQFAEGTLQHNQDTLIVWDGDQDHVFAGAWNAADDLDRQIKLAQHIQDHFAFRARGVAYFPDNDNVALQFESGWGNVLFNAKERKARASDNGGIGRILWDSPDELEQYVALAANCRRYAAKLASHWKPGQCDSPLLHVHGVPSVMEGEWTPLYLTNGGSFEVLKKLVATVQPDTVAMEMEAYIGEPVDGKRDEVFLVNFESANLPHSISFVWDIRQEHLTARAISLRNRSQLFW